MEMAGLCGDLRPGARVAGCGLRYGFLAGNFLNRGCRAVGIDLRRTIIISTELVEHLYSPLELLRKDVSRH